MNRMKRIAPIIFIVLAVVVMTSCTGAQKECAAYAKHTEATTPSFDEVQ
jgi:hypothetical protein